MSPTHGVECLVRAISGYTHEPEVVHFPAPLGHLDLDLVGAGQIVDGDAKTAGSNRSDSASSRMSAVVSLRIFSASPVLLFPPN